VLNILAFALLHFASISTGVTKEVATPTAVRSEITNVGGTGGWVGDVAAAGGTGGWVGDVAVAGGTGGWVGDVAVVGGTGGWVGDVAA
jgi:hypothetical protein